MSKVSGAHAHRFRHTLATALLAKGWTTRDVADVLGSSEAIIRHYAQWTAIGVKSGFGAWRKTCGMSAFCQGQKRSL
ncbi:MAG: site-specific integrase [Acidobacteriaceae bacterium]|nr:site-specific integrase [Acidobacteriaceae bacterium]